MFIKELVQSVYNICVYIENGSVPFESQFVVLEDLGGHRSSSVVELWSMMKEIDKYTKNYNW